MIVVGGTYIERCNYNKYWNELYGSGWRAVNILNNFVNDITFYSYLSKEDEFILMQNSIAQSDNVHLNFEYINRTISFEYYHPLSVPRISPPLHEIIQHKTFEIKGDNILRFGFLEGDAQVHGKKVVYDPQSSHNPKNFYQNGSTAEELVMILNLKEAKYLSKKNKVEEMTNLLENNTIAVIIKMGPLGGVILTNEKTEYYSAYKTEKVFSLGTGDIFATAFFFFWIEKKLPVKEAVEFASKTVSFCSENEKYIFDNSFLKKEYFPTNTIDNIKNIDKVIYIAGPFFNISQRWLIEEIRNNLNGHGIKIFSPVHDVGHGPAEEVVQKDIDAIHKSKAMIAIVSELDTGTIFEIGYARALNIPVVVYVENEKEEDLKMLEGTQCDINSDLTTAIYKVLWYAMDN